MTRETARTIILALAGVSLAAAASACSGDEHTPVPCPTRSRGSLSVAGKIRGCPVITAFQVVPPYVPVGSDALLSADASDTDSLNLAFSWTATAGIVADPSAPDTTLRCTIAGRATLTLSVSDGTCQDADATQVDCVPAGCGNGVPDLGEACDDGNFYNGDGCSAECTIE